jgi:hypothetical protein
VRKWRQLAAPSGRRLRRFHFVHVADGRFRGNARSVRGASRGVRMESFTH